MSAGWQGGEEWLRGGRRGSCLVWWNGAGAVQGPVPAAQQARRRHTGSGFCSRAWPQAWVKACSLPGEGRQQGGFFVLFAPSCGGAGPCAYAAGEGAVGMRSGELGLVGGSRLGNGACPGRSWALPQAPSPLPGHAAAFSQPWALGELPCPGTFPRRDWCAGVTLLPRAQGAHGDAPGVGAGSALGGVSSRSRSLLVSLLLPSSARAPARDGVLQWVLYPCCRMGCPPPPWKTSPWSRLTSPTAGLSSRGSSPMQTGAAPQQALQTEPGEAWGCAGFCRLGSDVS